MFELANHNDVELLWTSPPHLRAADDFRDLQSFLDRYDQGMPRWLASATSTT